jgi:hypothetical protein
MFKQVVCALCNFIHITANKFGEIYRDTSNIVYCVFL